MRLKTVFRRDGSLFRLLRVTWVRGTVGDGQGYSAKLSFGLRPVLFRWRRELFGWIVIICGLRIHYDRSYGGIHGA